MRALATPRRAPPLLSTRARYATLARHHAHAPVLLAHTPPRAAGRHFRHALSFPTSRLAHNLILPVGFSIFSVAVLAAYDAETLHLAAEGIHLPQLSRNAGLAPLGLSGSALSLLLVFRTNASYQRYTEGRAIWGAVVNTCRDIVRKSLLYFPGGEGGNGDRGGGESDAQKRAVARWTVALAHATRLHMRDQSLASLSRALPLEPAELAALTASSHRPNFCLQMLGKLNTNNVSDPYTSLSLDEALTRMEDLVGGIERLYRTPIPLSYTRHTSRLLLVWLLYLPVALYLEYGGVEAVLVAPLRAWPRRAPPRLPSHATQSQSPCSE